MKVRMHANSIRYRLKEPEVKEFAITGLITECIQFSTQANGNLNFSLQRTDSKNIEVVFDNNHIAVMVPLTIAEEWTNTGNVGFDTTIYLDGQMLKVLVEKDFECMDGNEADNIGTYPNPLRYAQ